MNQLFFEGKVTNLYAEDYQFLQDSVSDKVQAVIKYLVANKNTPTIVQGFNLSRSSINNRNFDIRHTSAWNGVGAILSGNSLFFETTDIFVDIPLDNYALNTSTGIYVVLDYIYASYDRVNKTLVEEERRAVDIYDNALVYNRKIEKIRVAQLTIDQYSALSDEQKRKHIYLGKFIAQGLGSPISEPDLTGVLYLTTNIVDHSIPLIKLSHDFMLPQRMVSPTSTGDINEDIYQPTPIDIHDDLNNIRTMIKRIKNTAHWNTPQEGVSGSLPQQNDLWKVGVFDHAFDDAPDSYFSLTLPATVSDLSAIEVYYSFNNGVPISNIGIDDSGNGRDAICNNVTSEVLPYGSAVFFNGVTTSIITPTIPRSNVVGQFFKIRSSYTGQSAVTSPTIFYYGPGSGSAFDSIVWPRALGSGYVDFTTQVDITNFIKVSVDAFKIFRYAGQEATISVYIETDYINNTKDVYINNELQVGGSTIITQAGSITSLAGVGDPYTLGTDGSGTNFISGVLDQFHVFNRILTLSERNRLHAAENSFVIGNGSALIGSGVRSILHDVQLPIPSVPMQNVGILDDIDSGEVVNVAALPDMGSIKEFVLSACAEGVIQIVPGSLTIIDRDTPSKVYISGVDYYINNTTGRVVVYETVNNMKQAVVACFYVYMGPRADMITINVDGITYMQGEISPRPTPPPIPYNTLPLYFVNRQLGQNYISPEDVKDARLKKSTIREATEINAQDIGCYTAGGIFQSRNLWSFHKYAVVPAPTGDINTITGTIAPQGTGWDIIANKVRLDPNYIYQTIVHFQDNDELWLDVVPTTAAYTITIGIETVFNSNVFDTVYSVSVPRSGASAGEAFPLFIAKGFDRGFYKLRILTSTTFQLNKILIGKYDFYFNTPHLLVRNITAHQSITTSGRFTSYLGDGSTPMQITSTTKVMNLNVDRIDDMHATNPVIVGGALSITANTRMLHANEGETIEIIHSTAAGYIHLPAGGSANQILKRGGAAGTGAWGVVTENNGALAAITTIGMSGVLTNTNTTASTTKDTGSIITEGGLGVEGNINSGGYIRTISTTASTSTTTGSIIAGGGLGVAGAINAGGYISTTITTAATSTTTGALIVAGGLGIAGAIYGGSTIRGTQFISTTTTLAPLSVASTVLVTSLNADRVDGYDAGNNSGQIPVSNNVSNKDLVAERLYWKYNNGGGHSIFDASNSTSPTGAAVNNTNPANAWAASYPTLMGWNGVGTYGVRVDSSRYADSAVASDMVDGYHASAVVTVSGALSITANVRMLHGTAGTAVAIAHLTTAGNIHLPAAGTVNQILKNSGTAGTGSWGTVTESSGALAAVTSITMSGQLINTRTTNQIVLGTTNTITITAPAVTASRTHTIPALTVNANFVMTQGTQTIVGPTTFDSLITGSISGNAVTVTNGVYTARTLTITPGGIATGGGTFDLSANRTWTITVPATNITITGGTTAGPTINSSTGTGATIPSASATASGIVTTGTQTFAGEKTFNSTIIGSISGNADTVDTYHAQVTSGVNTIPVRDGTSNIAVNTIRSSIIDEATISGAMAFRINNAADNSTRYCNSPTAIKSFLGLAGTLDSSKMWINDQQPDVYKPAQNYHGQNLNNIRATGFYAGEQMINAPHASWLYVTHLEHMDNNGYAIQKATSYFDQVYNFEYTRVCQGGVWQPWTKSGGDSVCIGHFRSDYPVSGIKTANNLRNEIINWSGAKYYGIPEYTSFYPIQGNININYGGSYFMNVHGISGRATMTFYGSVGGYARRLTFYSTYVTLATNQNMFSSTADPFSVNLGSPNSAIYRYDLYAQ